jgi:hypothetical protein
MDMSSGTCPVGSSLASRAPVRTQSLLPERDERQTGVMKGSCHLDMSLETR